MTDPAIYLRSVLLEKRLIGTMSDQLLTSIVQYPIGSSERVNRILALQFLGAHQRHLKISEVDARSALFRELTAPSGPNPLLEPTEAELDELLATVDDVVEPKNVSGYVRVLRGMVGRYGISAAPRLMAKLSKAREGY